VTGSLANICVKVERKIAKQPSAALRAKSKQPDLCGRSTTKQQDLYGRSTTKQPYARSPPQPPPPLTPPSKPGGEGGPSGYGCRLEEWGLSINSGTVRGVSTLAKRCCVPNPFSAAGRSWTWRTLRLCGEFSTHRTACAVPLLAKPRGLSAVFLRAGSIRTGIVLIQASLAHSQVPFSQRLTAI